MYVCNHVCMCGVGVCARACVRACVCMCAFVHKCASAYTRFSMGVQICTFCVSAFVYVYVYSNRIL